MSDLENSTQNIGNSVGAGFAHGLSTLPLGLQLIVLLSPFILSFILPLLPYEINYLNTFEFFGIGFIILVIIKSTPKLFISLVFLTFINWASIEWHWSNLVVIPVNLLFIFTFTHNFIQGGEVDNTGRCVRSHDIEETVTQIASLIFIALLAADYFDYRIWGLTMNSISWIIFIFTAGLSIHLAQQKIKEVIQSRSSYILTFLLSLCFMHWLFSIIPGLYF